MLWVNLFQNFKNWEKTVGRVVAEIDMGAGGSTLFLGFTIGYLELYTNSLPKTDFSIKVLTFCEGILKAV